MIINRQRQKIFRYRRKELLEPILALVAVILFIGFLVYLIKFSPRFAVKKMTSRDYIFAISCLIPCIVGIVYFFHLWLRRRSFVITVDDDGITFSRFDKIQKINWGIIESYIYQLGHPYWFMSLHPANGKCINIHGELEDFEDLIRLVKEKIRCDLREFQYTVRRRLSFIFTIYSICGAGIMIIAPMIYWLSGRKSLLEFLEFILIAVILFGWALFINLRDSRAKIFVKEDGLLMKPFLGKHIFMSWLEIKDNSQIEFTTHQATIVARIKKINIRVKNECISFCEDIDNLDELVNIIETKTGISLGV